AGTDGTVLNFGTAPAPVAAVPPGAPVAAAEATAGGDGVWLVTGGVLIGEFDVTCYALRGNTASGARVSEQVVAVDPRLIPLGTDVFVNGIGIRRALDTGGAVNGRRLDLWHPSAAWCRDFGVRRLATYRVP
ncbi:MAG: 3D domain-containing protein, partial [Acidimicrobiales bacterium]